MSINEKPTRNKLWRASNFCLVMLLFLGGMYFLKSIDDLMMRSVELDQLKSRLEVLQLENKEKQAEKNYLESYENISSRLRDLRMVKISNIDYIKIGEDPLAKK